MKVCENRLNSLWEWLKQNLCTFYMDFFFFQNDLVVSPLIYVYIYNITLMLKILTKKMYFPIFHLKCLLFVVDDWKEFIGETDDEHHLLYPLSINIDFQKSIVTIDPRMPQ